MKKRILTVLSVIFILTTSVVPVMAYTDVASDAWYSKDVQEVTAKGLMTGYPDGKFMPEGTVTRAEVAQVLYRINNSVQYGYETKTVLINDVDRTYWAYIPIRSLAEGWNQRQVLSLILPTGSVSENSLMTMFRPSEEATRGFVTAALWYGYNPDTGKPSSVIIGEKSRYHENDGLRISPEYNSITAFYRSGVIQGYPDGTLGANKIISRAEMAALLNRLF